MFELGFCLMASTKILSCEAYNAAIHVFAKILEHLV